jgi:hypothetical protein
MDDSRREGDRADRVLSRVQPHWDQARTERNLAMMLERLRRRTNQHTPSGPRRLRLSRA